MESNTSNYFEKKMTNIAVIIIFGIISTSIVISIVMSTKDYSNFKLEREEDRESNRIFFNKNCLDEKEMFLMRVVEECHKRQHEIEKDPSAYAIYDVLETWHVCGKDGCLGQLNKNSPHVAAFEIAIVTIVLIVVVLLAIAMCFCSSFLRRWSETILPVHSIKSKEF